MGIDYTCIILIFLYLFPNSSGTLLIEKDYINLWCYTSTKVGLFKESLKVACKTWACPKTPY